jgi:hypothetical protein
MSNKLYIPIIIGALGMLSVSDASAQRMAVKSNLLADALASPNIGVEFLVSPRWTLDIAAHYQPFAPRDGNTGCYNPKPATGCALLLPVISGESMPWAGVSM